MPYLKTYLQTITDRGNIRLAESIARTAEDVGSQHIRNFSFCSHEIGLLFGNVQSGKTGQMFGIKTTPVYSSKTGSCNPQSSF